MSDVAFAQPTNGTSASTQKQPKAAPTNDAESTDGGKTKSLPSDPSMARVQSLTDDWHKAGVALESEKPPEDFKAPEQVNPISAFGSSAGLLATIMGAFTRAPLTASLKAMTVGMKAIQDGNQAAYDKAYNEWKSNTEMAQKRFDWEKKQYDVAKDLMDQGKVDESIHHLLMTANVANDPIAKSMLESGNLDGYFKLQQSRETLAARMQEHSDNIMLRQEEMKLREQNHRDNIQLREIQMGLMPGMMSSTGSRPATTADSQTAPTATDGSGRDILSATGLSEPAFLALTGQSSQLPRDARTRKQAFEDMQAWAAKNGIDISTFGSQYKAMASVLEKNIQRNAQTQIMENEIQGTIENLQPVADAAGIGKLRIADIGALWAGQQVNDPVVQQYSFYLNQLREELAGYNAAIQGRVGGGSGGNAGVREDDYRQAEKTILNGINSGSLDGISQAVTASTQKMTRVLDQSIDNAHRNVWQMFGVGDKYKSPLAPKFAPHPDWPSAKVVKDGKVLKDESGKIVAKAEGGKWVEP